MHHKGVSAAWRRRRRLPQRNLEGGEGGNNAFFALMQIPPVSCANLGSNFFLIPKSQFCVSAQLLLRMFSSERVILNNTKESAISIDQNGHQDEVNPTHHESTPHATNNIHSSPPILPRYSNYKQTQRVRHNHRERCSCCCSVLGQTSVQR